MIEGVWSRAASKAFAWNRMSNVLAQLQKNAHLECIHAALDKYFGWNLAVHPIAILNLQACLAEYLVELMVTQYFTNTDDAVQNQHKKLVVQYARRALPKFDDPTLRLALTKSADFLAKFGSVDMQVLLIEAARK